MVYVLGWVGFRAVFAGGILTALLFAAFRPPVAVLIPVLIVLIAITGLLDMRDSMPEWFAWFRGRPPRMRRKSN